MRILKKALLSLAVIPASLLMVGPTAAAYPDKPITIVVPYPPGGSTDALGRELGKEIGEILKQTVIIENRAGAGSNIGAAHVAQSKPDGYTLLLGTSTALSVNESLYPNLAFSPQRDFEPVVLASMLPSLVVVPASLDVKTMEDLTAKLKKEGGAMNYASAGNGTPAHLAGELYKRMTGTNATHVPYKGGAPALVDLASGRTQYMFAILPESMPLVTGGKLKALAVTTAERVPAYPDIPTVAESGVPGFEVIGWYAFVAPAGTPADVVAKLNAAFNKALEKPEVRNKLQGMGFEIVGGSPDKLRDLMRSDSAKWKEVIREAGIKVD